MKRSNARFFYAAAALAAVAIAAASGCGGGGGDGAGEEEPAGDGHEHAHHHMPVAEAEGLAAAENGVRLALGTAKLSVAKQPLSFRIVDGQGKPVTDYELEQKRELHLIVVRRDLTEFQHLHPTRAPDGTWSIDISFAGPGTYRAFADFVPSGGEQTVLGADLEVGGGDFSPEPLPDSQGAVQAGEYDVQVDASEIEERGEGELALEISKDGAPVSDLQPYLGALGHSVILREGDLAYLHAHPLTTKPGADGSLKFHVALPTPSRYRAFVQFRHANEVHLAAFTIAPAS